MYYEYWYEIGKDDGEANQIKYQFKNNLKHDTKAISETFTVIPAVAMVLIGIIMFSIIIATAYTTFDNKQVVINNFENTHTLLQKICSPNTIFTEETNVINLLSFQSNEAVEYINKLQRDYSTFNISFMVKLSTAQEEWWLPSNNFDPIGKAEVFASSKKVSIKMNEVSTKPGELSIIMWKD